MNDGVKILLERMKTHPEEFVDETNLGATKWSGVLNYYDNVLTPEEKKAIQEGLLQLKRDAFTKQVMEILLDEVKPVEIDPNTYTMNRIGTTAEQLRARALRLTPTLQEQVDRIRAEHPFKPFIGEVK
jgi:hypothetical protein